MKLLKNKNLLCFLLLLVGIFAIRLIFLNLNKAEVGDSYNLLSAGEALKGWHYPIAEKRLPLLPFLLSLNHWFDQVIWGRILVMVVSLASLIVSADLYQKVSKDKKYLWFLLLVIATQPIWAYWSLRIMTDVLFGFLVLLSWWYYVRQRENITLRSSLILGLLVGLAILTRYEGLLLALSFGLVILLKRRAWSLLAYSLPGLSLVSLWLLRNFWLFGSLVATPYVKEASNYLPNFEELMVFLAYSVFLFGPMLTYFSWLGVKVAWQRHRDDFLPIIIFLFLYLPLVLLWTAGVPRLFYPLVPIMGIIMTLGIEGIKGRNGIGVLVGLLGIFITGIFFLPLEFLSGGVSAILILGLLSLGILGLLGRFGNKYLNMALLLIIVSNLAVSLEVIDRAKNRFSTTVAADLYARNLPDLVGYADETGVSSWYLRNNGLYWNGDTGYTEALIWMQENQVRYVVVTNEHFEEGAQFLVVYDEEEENKFKLLKRVEREEWIDPARRFVEQLGIVQSRERKVRYSEVYEVLSYRPPGP